MRDLVMCALNGKIKSFISFVLALILSFTCVFSGVSPVTSANAEELDSPMNLQIAWENTDGQALNIDEKSATTNVVRLKVTYSQTKVSEEGYAAGELIITVKGIGGVNRTGTIEALVGADEVNATSKTRDWSYSWNKSTDTYTFTNNNRIKAGAVFSGYFELVWELNARACQTDYSQTDVVASIYLPDGSVVDSNTLSFANKSYCDTYSNLIEQGTVYSAEGFENMVSGDVDDYIWIRYNLYAWVKNQRTRGLKAGAYNVFNPDADGVGSGAVVFSNSITVKSNSTYEANGYLTGITTDSYFKRRSEYVYVAYPRSSYEGKSIRATLNTYGSFYEHNEDGTTTIQKLASSALNVVLSADFSFTNYPGDIYSFEKMANASWEWGTDMLGEKNIVFYLYSSLNLPTDDSARIELGDDFLYVLQNDGNYRQLTKDDYEFTSIYVPSVNELKNRNGFSIKSGTYPVAVYAAQNGEALTESAEQLVWSGTLGTSGRNVTLPANTTSVVLVMDGLKESIACFDVPISVKFHLDESKYDTAAQTDLVHGKVVNTSFIRVYVYDESGKVVTQSSSNESFYHDDSINLDLAQKDIDTYGEYLHRESASFSLYGKDKSNYSNTVSLSQVSKLSNGAQVTTMTLTGTFDFVDSDTPDQFSLYGIVPSYLNIRGATDADSVWDTFSISTNSLGVSSSIIKEHSTVEVIENYNSSDYTYVAIHVDLSDLENVDVTADGVFAVSVPLAIDSTYYSSTTLTGIGVTSALTIDKDGNYYTTGKVQDDGTWFGGSDSSFAADINHDGDTTDYLSRSVAYQSWQYANSSQWSMDKTVKSSTTGGDYISAMSKDDAASVAYGDTYSYALTVTCGNSELHDMVVFDSLESEDASEWHGTLKSVNLSRLKNIGVDATVYYSEKNNPSTDLTSSDWSTSLSPEKAKSIAIDMRGSVVPASSSAVIIVNMIAPTDTALKNKYAVNTYHAIGTMVDSTTGYQTVIDDQLHSNETYTVLTPTLRKLFVTKQDEENGEGLADAVFNLYEKTADGRRGTLVATATTNDIGKAEFANLPDDVDYVLVETFAPYGYELADNVTVHFDGSNARVVVKDTRKKGSITVRKSNSLMISDPVAGAVYALYNADGKELSRATTGSNGAATFTDLVWGDYTVKEVHSPDGFLLNETEYAVSITRENCETVQSVKTTDEQATTVFSLTKYVALTTGVNTTTPLAGATFRLTYVTDSGQTDYGLFVTDKNGTIYMEDIPYGTYIVSEYRSPAGYIKCDNMTVTFSPSNRYVTLNLYDTRKSGQIIMVKMDDNNSLVEGAEYGLYTTSDTLVKQGVTDDAGTLYFTDLEWGDYYLAEITAPQGYELSATHYPVTIDGTNLVATVNVQDETIKGSVVLTKTDEKGNNTLAGAEYALYKTNGTLVSDGLVTDKNGTIRVNDLAWGSYYFQETSAPTGYTISTEPIRFSINAQNASIVQTLYATDKQDSRTVAVTKRIKADEINFANGNPTFLFQLSGKDVNGNSHTYTQLVTFDEEYVKENTTADGYVTQQAFFTDLLAGTYTLSEDDSARYVLESISGYGEAQKKGDTVVFDLTKYAYGEATFQNKVYEGQNYSHNDNVKNIVSTGAALTGLTVKYTGASRVEAESKVSPSTLIVTAYYDDGSSAILSSDEYELALSQYPNENGSYTNTVSYTYHGVTKSGTYTVTIYGQKERVTSLTVTYNGDEIFVNDTLSKSDFTVVANYNTGKTKTLSSTNTYLTMSPTTAPSEAGNFDVTFSYTEDSKTTTGTISLTAAQAIPWLATNTMSLIDDAIGGASTSFTLDFEPPFVYESAIAEDSVFTVIDVSEAGNNSVVAVVNYDSTSGYSIIICPTSGFRYAALPRDCSSFFANQSKMSFVATQYLDISYVTNMSHMFDHCTSLENIDALANWDTHNVTDMSDMFYYCYSLTELDVSGFDTSNVTNMSEMFYDCSSLTELDVSGFDTSNVTNMSEMFAGCRSITTLDLFNWSSASLSANGATSMFAYCTSLQTIYTSESFDLSTKKSSADVFTNCYYLVGGLGTSYNSSHVNYAYGHLDSVSNPGYFTYYLPITGIAATVAENVEINDDTELTPEDFNVSMVYEGGVSTSIPVGVASYAQVGDLATATSPNWPNKYSNNLTEANTAQEFTFDGAQYITVEFDSTSKLESASCDWVSVYDADGTNYGGKGVLGGTAIAGTTLTIPGNYVKIAMRSDSSSTYKGYSATITAYGTAGYSSYNYTVERSSDADGNLIAIITLDPDCCGTAYQTTVALS